MELVSVPASCASARATLGGKSTLVEPSFALAICSVKPAPAAEPTGRA